MPIFRTTPFVGRVILLALWVGIQGCGDDSEKIWEGTVFPTRGNPAMKIKIRKFRTLELCRDVAKIKLRAMQISATGDYECRKNCRINESGNQMCEETSR